ncbi:MAG TPA: LegC family aminotransferase [Nitrospirae bacterium]|nr:LegC family aminotransferase [Nitrospirota bacterium]
MNSRNIPLSIPVIQGNEWKYVKECLDTGWVSSVGEFVNRFEKSLAEYTGCRYAVSTVNGTAALHVSLVASGITAGDEVIVPSLTFVATANAVRYCGAEPVFVDCDKETLCIDTDKLREFLEENTYSADNITYNKETKRPIRAIIPVHIFGHPADMDPLCDLADKYNITVIEDATESLGSKYKGRNMGSLGRLGCVSFNGNKIITSGGGGMVVTNDESLAAEIKHLTTQARSDDIEYAHDKIGYNYRLTNIQAAVGLAQMEKLDEFVDSKRKHAAVYTEMLSGVKDVHIFGEQIWAKSNFWYITIKVSEDRKKSLMELLLSKGIQVRPVWKPLHTLPMYKDSTKYKITNAVDAYNTCFNIPSSVTLTNEEIEYIVENITGYYNSL